MISRHQRRVPAKHLRIVQVLRIRRRQVMIPCDTIEFGSSYLRRIWTFVSSCFSCILWLLSDHLFVFWSDIIYTTINRHQHLLLPQVIQRLWVSKLPAFVVREYLLHCCMSMKSRLFRILCTCISSFIRWQLVVSQSFVYLFFSDLLHWHNDQSPSTKSPSQAPTDSPSTPDPTKASKKKSDFNVMLHYKSKMRNKTSPPSRKL